MRYILILLLVAAVAGIVWLALSRSRPKAPIEFRTTDEMMAWFSTQAVEMARDSYQVKLDYSIDSIETVEGILGKLHNAQQKRKSEEGVNGLAMAFGAYVGECIRRHTPGSRWDRDHPVAGEKSYPLHWVDGESFPCAWCYKRIINGPEDSVWHKYQVLSQQRAQAGPATQTQPK